MLLQCFQGAQPTPLGLHQITFFIELAGKGFTAAAQLLNFVGAGLSLRQGCGIFLGASFDPGGELVDFPDRSGRIEGIEFLLQALAPLVGMPQLAFDMFDATIFDLGGLVRLMKFTPELIPQLLPLLHFFFGSCQRRLLLPQAVIAGLEHRRNRLELLLEQL